MPLSGVYLIFNEKSVFSSRLLWPSAMSSIFTNIICFKDLFSFQVRWCSKGSNMKEPEEPNNIKKRENISL